MPSVSNYGTPCGPSQMHAQGMVFELSVNSNKPVTYPSKQSHHAEQFSASGLNNTAIAVPNFHGSSNGYYGYHMLTSSSISNRAESSDECVMDTDDFCNHGMMTSHPNNDRLIDDARRKRALAPTTENHPKRSRQECISDGLHLEGSPQSTPPPPTHQTRNISRFDDVRRSTVLRRPIKSSNEISLTEESSLGNKPRGEDLIMKNGFVGDNQKNLELMEVLLKETHGCDFYNYRVCDL